MSTFTAPYTWTTDQILTSAALNQTMAEIGTAVNNIDHTNMGAAGIYASSLIPTTTGQATFGGTQAYTFPNGVISGSGFCPPLLTAAGASYGATSRFVGGTANIPVSTSTNNSLVAVTLTNGAVFTSSASYLVFIQFAPSPSFPSGWNIESLGYYPTYFSGSSFYISVVSSTLSSGSGSVNVQWLAVGY